MADKAREWTDEQLEKLEKKISRTYKQAEKELTKKWKAYMKAGEERLSALEKEYAKAKKSGDATSITQAKDKLQKAKENYTLRSQYYKDMVDSVTMDIAKVNQMALTYVNNELPRIYAANYEQIKDQLDDLSVSFSLVDKNTVMRMIDDGDIKLPKKKLDVPKDQRWNTKKINSSVLQGILQGESIGDISKRLLPIMDNNKVSAIRNARTLVTGAENRGRLDSYNSLKEQGAVLKKVWIATGDSRTRDWHLIMDGQEVDIDEDFVDGNGNKLEYPADPSSAPETVYNCRCSMHSHIIGFRKADGSISYIDYEPESGMHEQQIAAEKARREKEQPVVQETTIVAEPNAIKLPEDFFKKKQSDALEGFLDTVEGKDADVAKLYGTLNDMMKNQSYPMKVSYTAKNHQVVTSYYRSTGGIADITVQIPKMDGDPLSQSQTTVHELGHFLDLLYGGNKHVSETNDELKNALLNGNPMSEKVKSLFEQLKKNGNEAYEKVMTPVKQLNAEINDKISKAYEDHDWKAISSLQKDREKAWKQGTSDALSAMRSAHEGYQGLEDIYDAILGGKLQNEGYFGHGTKYYASKDNRASETFANFCALSQTNPQALQILKEEQPEIYNACKNMVKEMLGGK